jgi:hypothetical protein
MVRHYFYDGCGRHDQDDVAFEWNYADARRHITDIHDTDPDYDWVYDTVIEDFILIRKEGQYGYDYYFIKFMTPGEEID